MEIVFSIIIPTYNRHNELSNCLKALIKIEYPQNYFEVIIIDDGSKIPVNITKFKKWLNISLIRQKNSGPAKARNTGAEIAKGKFLVFTDDDCIADTNLLKNLEIRIKEKPNCLIGGKTINALPNNIYSTASQELINYLYSYYNNPEKPNFFTSNNFTLPKSYGSSVLSMLKY
ncbi:glycosyltransferase family A protein [Kamptonema sp. UHCC 0994]|nr:glycosyltransferase family A protein [Kamptonema sp. UHCC 0994]